MDNLKQLSKIRADYMPVTRRNFNVMDSLLSPCEETSAVTTQVVQLVKELGGISRPGDRSVDGVRRNGSG